jgi:hypothetical protein
MPEGKKAAAGSLCNRGAEGSPRSMMLSQVHGCVVSIKITRGGARLSIELHAAAK